MKLTLAPKDAAVGVVMVVTKKDEVATVVVEEDKVVTEEDKAAAEGDVAVASNLQHI